MGSYGEFGKREWVDDLPLDFKQIHAKLIQSGKLLTEDRVQNALKKGIDPIILSIGKWIRIRTTIEKFPHLATITALFNNIGSNTCGLCFFSIEKLRVLQIDSFHSSDKCQVCPLGKIDCCNTKNSIFKQIESIVFRAKYVTLDNLKEASTVDEFLKLCTAMIENLEKCRN